jgi:hypothetical protein
MGYREGRGDPAVPRRALCETSGSNSTWHRHICWPAQQRQRSRPSEGCHNQPQVRLWPHTPNAVSMMRANGLLQCRLPKSTRAPDAGKKRQEKSVTQTNSDLRSQSVHDPEEVSSLRPPRILGSVLVALVRRVGHSCAEQKRGRRVALYPFWLVHRMSVRVRFECARRGPAPVPFPRLLLSHFLCL